MKDNEESPDSNDAPAPEADELPTPAKKKKKKKRKKRARKPVEAESASERTSADGHPPKQQKSGGIPMIGYGLAVATLVAGAAAGWFLRDARATETDAAAEPVGSAGAVGSAGPCGNWSGQICSGAGDKSAACAQAKAATEIMPAKACSAAIPEVKNTLADLKTKRATCDQVVTKLCADLGKDSPQCQMIQQQGSAIPAAKCQELLDNYDKVLASLKQPPGMPGMRPGGPPGMRPGGPPGKHPGGPPGMRPGGAPIVKPITRPPAPK